MSQRNAVYAGIVVQPRDPRGLGRLQVRLPRSLGADAERGQDLLEVRRLARRARGRIAFAHQRLELMLAGAALVFVNRHRYDFDVPLRNGPNKSIGTGRKVVVLCSLEISRIVWRNRS